MQFVFAGVFTGDILHEMSDPVFWENSEKYHRFVVCWMSPESGEGKLIPFLFSVDLILGLILFLFSVDLILGLIIMKTYLYNFYPLKPHFHVVKLGFTGVYIIFLFLLKNIDCGYSLEPPRLGGSNEYPQSMFWAEIRKILAFFIWKFSIFGVNFCYIFE